MVEVSTGPREAHDERVPLELETLSCWRRGKPLIELDPASAPTAYAPGQSVLWFEWMAPKGGRGRPYDLSDILTALEALSLLERVEGLEARMTTARLAALATGPKRWADREPSWAQPGIHAHEGIITAAAVALPSHERLEAVGAVHALRTARVSLVVLPSCLVTIRWRPQMRLLRSRQGAVERLRAIPDDRAYLFAGRRDLRAMVEQRWIADCTILGGRAERGVARESGDLAVLAIEQLTKSFPSVVRDLAVVIDDLEEEHLRVFLDAPQRQRRRRRSSSANQPSATAHSPEVLERHWIELAHTLSELHRQIAPLRKYEGPLYGIENEETLERLKRRYDDALDEVRGLRQDFRASMDSIAGLTAAEQLVTAQKQEEHGQRTRALIDRVAAFVLVPTLVAGVFGANVTFPGQGSVTGFLVLLILMVASGALTFFMLHHAERRRHRVRFTIRSANDRAPQRPQSDGAPQRRAWGSL